MKNVFYLFLFFLFLKTLQKRIVNEQSVKQILLSVGFPKETISLFLAQAGFESGGFNFNSNVNKTDNNLTGIIWLNKPYQNATKGLPMPKSDGNGFYAHFPSIEAWAKDFKRILSLNTGGKGRPIDAKDVMEFVTRLKANGYFGGDEKKYLAGVVNYQNKVSNIA